MLYGVPPLHMARLRFELALRTRLRLGREQRGDVLRGTLGENLKRITCAAECREPQACPRDRACAYAQFFEPLSDKGAAFGARNAPRPFVLRPDPDPDPEFGPHRPLTFELRLFGTAIASYNYFVRAFLGLAESHLHGVEVAVTSLVSLDWMGKAASVLIRDSQIFAALPVALDFAAAFETISGGPRARLEFETPTRVNARDSNSPIPSFPALVSRVRDRVSLLSMIWEERDWAADYGGIGHFAADSEVIRQEGAAVTYRRESARTGETIHMTGFCGTITYGRVHQDLWPLLRIGQEIHVGRYTDWGLGRYRIVT
jgi:CRISPR-associated endoribonuclease Cas6